MDSYGRKFGPIKRSIEGASGCSGGGVGFCRPEAQKQTPVWRSNPFHEGGMVGTLALEKGGRKDIARTSRGGRWPSPEEKKKPASTRGTTPWGEGGNLLILPKQDDMRESRTHCPGAKARKGAFACLSEVIQGRPAV